MSGIVTGPPHEPRGAAPGLFDAFDSPRHASFRLSIWDGDGFAEWTWDDWRSKACRAGAALRGLGIGSGSRVACILTNVPAACAAVPGIWLAGGTVLSLPTIARGMSFDRYVAQLRRICDAAHPDAVLMEAAFAAAFPDDALPVLAVHSYESLDSSGRIEPSPPGRDDVAFVQYSSGSTSDPHGCMLTAGAIARQMEILSERVGIDPERDHTVSWLPLSHDMGLFGVLVLAFCVGMRSRLSTPQRFLRSPGTWMDDCARARSTITVAPNFALELAVRAARVQPPGPFPMRRAVIGGERVEPRTVAVTAEVIGPSGLTAASLVPAYGLAEGVLAVSMKPVGEATNVIEIDRAALTDHRLVDAEPVEDWYTAPGHGRSRLVSAGAPLRGVRVGIDGPDAVGEICVSTPSLAVGYLGDEAFTRARLRDGEVRTGDIGFVHDGEVYVVGRLDDMISVGGRNIFARDVEVAAGDDVRIRPGSCVLVDLPDGGGGRLLGIAEPAKGASDFDGIARSLADAVREATGFRLHECLIVPPGTLPKTPSGKIQRFRCRELVETGELEPLARAGG
jgi:acyl-CoA synthetase (AMP-forming)/AMP-acid ligase II